MATKVKRTKVKRKYEQSVEQPSLWQRPVVWGAVVVGVVLALGLVWLLSAQGRQAAQPAVTSSTYAGMPVQGRVVGTADAPVTIVEYSDFQCPHCATAHETIYTPVVNKYVKAGKVRFEVHPVAFLGPASQLAAEAALCAQDQGQFFPYHDRLFAAQRQYGRGAFTEARLKEYAAEIGLDLNAFSRCLDSRQHAKDVERLNREAQRNGVTGTPTFFVNGTKVEGAIPFEQFYKLYLKPFVE